MNISSVTQSSQNQTATSSASLGPDQFLTLLMAELQTQDPTNPLDTQSMVTQLSTIEMVSENRSQRLSQQFSQATLLLGRQVAWQEAGKDCSGMVTGVLRDGSTTELVVGGSQLSLDQIVSVSA
jgi:flagellar basal-body rod modification protein FlgD